jgi:hypothetical protein
MVSTSDLKYKFSETGYITLITNGGEKQIPIYLAITSVIFEDDFNNPNSGWGVSSDAKTKTEYLNGKYRFLNKNDGIAWRVRLLKIGYLDDFVFEVDAQWFLTSSLYNYYGVAFRDQDDDNDYAFYVSSATGQYGIGKTVNGTVSELKGFTESTYIKKGTAVNRLKVVCQGSQISVYVNDVLLTTVSDSSLSRGYVGLMVGKSGVPDADALFDNLKISAP